MKVKNSFVWKQSFSAIPDGIKIPAGAPVYFSKDCDCFFVNPKHFDVGSIEKDDAHYYGCRVNSDNVEEI